MTLLNPLGLLLLSLAPVVVLLYLRRVRRREVSVPTLLFWQRALGEQRRTAFLGRLRQWLSLLLHLLILLLLTLAVARPEWGKSPLSGQSTVILLDTRARMQATLPEGGSRFEAARRHARALAATAREGNEIALLAIGARPEVLAPMSAEPLYLLEALEAATPGESGGEIGEALTLARHLLATRPVGHRLVVLSDGGQLPSSEEVEIMAGAGPLDNVAITGFAARSEPASPQTAALLLELANFSAQESAGQVEIEVDGKLLDVRPFTLAPGERKSDFFASLPGAAPGKLVARLALAQGTPDALALDNTAYTLLPTPRPPRVLLVSEGNWFLEKLLTADRSIRFELLTLDGFRPEMARAFDVVIHDHDALPPLEELTGPTLVIRSNPFAGESGKLANPPVTDVDAGNPLLRLVHWSHPTLFEATQLAPEGLDSERFHQLRAEGWSFHAPIRSFEHPLVLTAERGEQRLAVIAFDLTQSDLPLRVAFPLLISNTLQWLHSPRPTPPSALRAGETLVLPAGSQVTGPDGAAVALSPQRPLLQPRHNGFYSVSSDGEERWLAVNTGSEAESDLRITPAANALPAPTLAGVPPFLVRPPWQWLTLAALLLLFLEWWLFHRRRTE